MSEKIKRYSKTAIVVGLILMLVAMYELIPLVEAATVTSRKDTLSDSRPSTLANHTIQFVTPTGVNASTDTITLTFAAGFTMGTFALLNFDLAVDTTDPIGDCGSFVTEKTLAAAPGASPIWGVGQAGSIVTFTAPTDAGATEIAAGSCVQIEIGSNATAGGAGSTQITNPTKVAASGTADISDIDIAGVFGDTGKIKVATIEGVTVKATITETLTFTIGNVAAGSCLTDTGSPTVVSTTSPTEVDFGTLAADAFKAACHELSVTTNADGGYVLTTQETTNMQYVSTNLIDTTCDGGTCSQITADDWATASANQGLGHTCTNTTGTPCNTVYTAAAGICVTPPCYRQFACVGSDANCDPGTGLETAETFMSSSGPAADAGKVHYKISINSTQAAGLYQNTIVYIVTPTY